MKVIVFLFWVFQAAALTCAPPFNCGESSENKFWVYSKQPTLASCSNQCQLAFEEIGGTICDTERNVTKDDLTMLPSLLGFQCVTRQFVKNVSQFSASVQPPKRKNCLFPLRFSASNWPQQTSSKQFSFTCDNDVLVNVGGFNPVCACRPPRRSDFAGFNLQSAVPPAVCAVNNGECDIHTTCTDTANGTICGPCPEGFSGNGDTGCVDINECAIAPPVCGSLTCTNTNLTQTNVTTDSCICNGTECVQVSNASTFAASGIYNCTHYSRTTNVGNGWEDDVCDQYQFQNFTLSLVMQQLPLGCVGGVSAPSATRWIIYIPFPNGTQLYKSGRIYAGQSTALSNSIQFGFVNCVTLQGCTEVLSCGVDMYCYIRNNTCFDINGTVILRDNATLSSACYPALQPDVVQGRAQDGSIVTATVNDAADFEVNGEYTCTNIGGSGCDLFVNKHLFQLGLAIPNPVVAVNCTAVWRWRMTNQSGAFVSSDEVYDPRLGPSVAVFPASQVVFVTPCIQRYTCGNCSSGYQKTSFNTCQEINECATNNGGCPLNSYCNNTNGSFVCTGVCYPQYEMAAGAPDCVPQKFTNTLRVRIQNSHTGNYIFDEPGNLVFKIPMLKGFGVNFAVSYPLGTIASSLATLNGRRVFTMWDGNFTLLTHSNLFPINFNGMGRLNLNLFAQGTYKVDTFLTSYYIPRAIFTTSASRAGVLSCQPQDLPSVFHMLDLKALKFHPTNFGCTATCCLATPGSGLCGTIQIMNNSDTTDKVEEFYMSDLERTSVSGPFYSYLIYADVSVASPNSLFFTNAQIRFFSLASARNPEATGTFQLVAPSANSLPILGRWLICCILVNSGTGAITYRDLKNGTFSQMTPTAVPVNPQAYCQ